MNGVAIIGAGRLGSSLGRALAAKGYPVVAITCRRPSSAGESRRKIGRGKVATVNTAAAAAAEVVFLCLPDDEIGREVRSLSRTAIAWRGKTVFHTSGCLSSRILGPLKRKGAAVGSFHPAQSFPKKGMPPSRFRGIIVGLEGDRTALSRGEKIARDLGGQTLILAARAKPLYHAACSIASGFIVVLLSAATRVLSKGGIDERAALRLLLPLAEGTLQNVKKFGTAASLSGPFARADKGTVAAHLRSLLGQPDLLRLYRELGLAALETPAGRLLPARKIRALRSLLEDR